MFKFFKMQRSFFVSLLMHSVLLLSCVLYFSAEHNYVSPTLWVRPVSLVLNRSSQINVKETSSIPARQSPQHNTINTAVIHADQKNNDVLLQLLHSAIAVEQQYPDEAIANNQDGSVTIKLLLYPDGHLENITLAKSSGVASIDLAALNAVKSIHDIAGVERYLKNPQSFSVDVVFTI